MGFSQQEYWSGLPFHPPEWDLPHSGIEAESPEFPALAGGFFTTSAKWEAPIFLVTFWAQIPGMEGSLAISLVYPVAKWISLAFLFFVTSTVR